MDKVNQNLSKKWNAMEIIIKLTMDILTLEILSLKYDANFKDNSVDKI